MIPTEYYCGFVQDGCHVLQSCHGYLQPGVTVYGLWFMVDGLWFMVFAVWFRMYSSWSIICGSEFKVEGAGFIVEGLGSGVQGVVLRGEGFRFRFMVYD